MVSAHSRLGKGEFLMYGTRVLKFLAVSLAAGMLYFS